jgi:putative DNA primase/helicase
MKTKTEWRARLDAARESGERWKEEHPVDLSSLIAKLDDSPVPASCAIPKIDFQTAVYHDERTNEVPRSTNLDELIGRSQLNDRQITTGKDGNLKACFSNVLDFLRFHDEWFKVLAFNEFTQKIVTKRETPFGKPAGEIWTDVDTTRTVEWLERKNCFVNSSVKTLEAVICVAHEYSFHPIRDYLASLIWDKVPRVNAFFSGYLGAANTRLNAAASSSFFIGAIARITKPGIKNDIVPVLSGEQGRRKSMSIQALCPDPEYFTDHISALGSKDSRAELAGRWLIELGEMARVKGHDLEVVKNFISCQVDHYRPSYGRMVADYPRQCVFIGTTNDRVSLNDETGARRFIPVEVTDCNVEAITRDRDQLWAEARERFHGGEKWWIEDRDILKDAKEQQDGCYLGGPWDCIIEAWIENPQPMADADRAILSVPGAVLVEEILKECIGKTADKWTQADANAVTRCLTHLGYKRTQRRLSGRRPKVWVKDGPL